MMGARDVTGRLSEPLKFLPVAFILSLIAVLYAIYFTQHLQPLLAHPDPIQNVHGRWCFAAFHSATAMVWICYARCLLTSPGTVSDLDEDGSSSLALPSDQTGTVGAGGVGLNRLQGMTFLESKRTGDRRHCKWCNQFKPDRCHHCRVCRKCVLKMDHHCPWIYNCVGFRNHKYFLLLLVYTALDCHVITWTMLDTVRGAILPETPFWRMFFLLFGETLAAFLGALATAFLVFHIWLMLRAMTTIEFCEKAMKRWDYDPSIFSRGFMGNVRAVLGDEPLLWLLPLSSPSGSGMDFGKTETSPLAAAAGLRRRAAMAASSGGTGSAPETDDFSHDGSSKDPFLQGTAARPLAGAAAGLRLSAVNRTSGQQAGSPPASNYGVREGGEVAGDAAYGY